MNILFVTSYYKPAYVYGGPSRSIPALCEGLNALSVDVTVFTTNAAGKARLDVPLSQAVDVDGVEVWYFPVIPSGDYNFASRQQSKAIQDRLAEYDIVIADSVWGQLLGSVHSASRLNQVPYIVSLRGQLMPWSLDQKYLKKKIYLTVFGHRYLRAASAFHCTNPLEAEEASKLNLGPQAFVVPNAIDFTLYSGAHSFGDFRHKYQIPEDVPVLLYLGRLHPNKNPLLCIEVLADLKDVHPELVLVLAGPEDGVKIREVYLKAHDCGVGDRVICTGLLQGLETIEAFGISTIGLITSSVNESFGMSALESMAAGVPLVSSDLVPVAAWAAERGAAIAVRPSVKDFSIAVNQILSNEELERQMSDRGKEFVKTRFDSPAVARQMVAQLESIVQTGKPLNSSLHDQ